MWENSPFLSPTSAILYRMFTAPPTSLETAVAQASNDLKVSGFGQRTRAALRRNLAAGENTVLPDHVSRSIPGPDLVRHLNALILIHAVGNPYGNQPHDVDRELFGTLDDDHRISPESIIEIPHSGLVVLG